MKIIRNVTLLFVLVCALFSVTRAGDYATLNFIGFSKNGNYLAFEEYGTQDGSGFPYSNIYVIDVARNAFASTPVRIRIDKETATEALARSRAKLGATSALKRFGIVAGNNGKLVVSRLLTDITASKDASTINFAEIVGSMYREGDYDLVLKSYDVKVKECDYNDEAVQKLELTLKDNNANKTIVLQKDPTLPPSRGCPLSYGVQYIYLYENHIAVFLNTFYMGFEGPDMRYLAVTGKYK